MALNFPAKIYLILENESADIIKWHPNGFAFRIVDHGRFEREIIPKYFRHNQLSSVQRQLNLYGFKCINRGEDKGAFYHPRFKRGDWEIVKKITRYSPSKKPGDSPQFGDEKSSVDFETLETSFTSGSQMFASVPSSSETAFQQSSVGSSSAFSSQPYGFPPYHFDSAAANSHHWYPPNVYGHVNFNMPMDFHHGAHFVSSFPHSTTTVAPIPTYPQPSKSELVSTSTGTDNSAMSMCSTDSDSSSTLNHSKTEEKTISASMPQKKSFVTVINDVVLVDPYFDLDAELDMFSEVGLANSTMMSTSPIMAAPSNKREMGVNTDLTQALHNLSYFHQVK